MKPLALCCKGCGAPVVASPHIRSLKRSYRVVQGNEGLESQA